MSKIYLSDIFVQSLAREKKIEKNLFSKATGGLHSSSGEVDRPLREGHPHPRLSVSFLPLFWLSFFSLR